jgi:predicted ATPase/DNA-binding SARP family transcriptional activator
MGRKLELILFGNLEIRLAGELLTEFKSKKAQALLCYLAVTGQPHRRSALANLLWSNKPEAAARMNLSQALSELRRFFGDYLNITRQTVALDQDHNIYLDVDRFEEEVTDAFNEPDIPSLQKAILLYRGDFLDNLYISKTPEFELWVLSERARLNELALKTLRILAVYFSIQGEVGWEKAIDYTAHLLTLNPWQEEAHRLMMLLKALSRQRSEALIQYKKCCQALADNLGVEPGADTTELYERIRDNETISWTDEKPIFTTWFPDATVASKRAITFHKLPAQTTSFIGRETELNQLVDLLSNPAISLVSIVGTGGIGKTELALAVAHRLAKVDRYRDGIFFVPLSSATTQFYLVSSIAKQFGLSLAGMRQPEEVLFDFLSHKTCLLILDNFEQLLPEVNFIVRLLQAAPLSKLLVTSRERLKLREEWVIDLQGLPYPNTIQEARSSNYDAICLFVERAQQIRSNFSLEMEIQAVVRICQLTQGMPLALEQAASLIRANQAGEIADQIEVRLDALSTTLRNIPERHHSMRSVFDWSWQWLSAEELEVFPLLSVFEGSFTHEAAEQVVDASLSTLSSLVDKSLLQIKLCFGKATRYELHNLIRQYATERLLLSGFEEIKRIHDTHLDYFLSLSERAEQFWDTNQEKEWLQRLEDERSNLHAAISWATEHEKTEQALRMNAALFTFWVYNSPAAEAVKWLETSLSMSWDEFSSTIMQARAKALNVAGYAALPTSNYELAKSHFKEGSDLYSTLGDQLGLAWSLRGCGFVCMILGNLVEAEEFVRESREKCEEIQDEWGSAWSTYDLGNIALAKVETVQAESLLESAFTQFQQLGNQFGSYRALISLGHLKRAQGKQVESTTYYREALNIQQETHYIQFVAQILEGLAHLAVAENNSIVAVKLFGAAQSRRDSIEMARWAHHEIDFQRNLALTKSQLSQSEWKASWEEGFNFASHRENWVIPTMVDGSR